MSWPTFQQLKYLVAIADTGSFGAAAEEEFVSQPALSAQIKELERKLGVMLLERSARGAMLTAHGVEVVERARVVMRDMHDLIETTKHDGKQLRGHIALGVIPTLAPYVLPDVVRAFTAAHSDAELHIRELQTTHLLESLRYGDIDFGLLALPIGTDEFVTAPIRIDNFLLAMPENHSLAKGKTPVKLEVLRNERVILLEDGHCLRDQVSNVCQLAFSEPSEIQATSMATLAQMVAAGLGVTLLPECAEKVEAGPGRGIVTRKFAGQSPSRTIGLVWRKSSPFSDAFDELCSTLSKK
ncbi:MAG: hydrogen peroxide-inducible genes activator [Ilumatobacteraceae bacterium]|jgi:LysR family transcriptional regulator, hydrogen peroxide-inducible genes activator|nr:hydrogen peroxide-inducible genes activator [Ilumatobacteraceae bacterium]MDP4702881.1 hydrogen peroxide-inducible genes activator [Ilumatobacteraceae bacterium]